MTDEKDFSAREFVPRGFLYPYILVLLSGKPLNGYAITKKIKEHTGFWHPSAGSVYPALSYLRKKGYIIIVKKTRKSKLYSLTDKGRETAGRVEQTKKEMKEKFAEMLGEILDIDKHKISAIFEHMKKEYKSGDASLLELFAEMRASIFVIPARDMNKAKSILSDANLKLKKLAKP